jgi:hypothetical protein
MKYLKKFNTAEEYAVALEGGLIDRPNVSLIGRDTINFLPLLPPSSIYIDQTITDPTLMITGDVNGAQLQAIRSNTHRYVGKYTDSGTMTICQLDDTNSSLYADGSTADLTGAEGDVFVRLPKFAYKAEEQETDKWKISFVYGDAPDSSWMVWDGNDLIGVYDSYVSGNKLYSYSGVLPSGNLTKPTFKAYANARGKGFSLLKWKHHCIVNVLFYATYGNTTQGLLGKGINATNNTGGTNGLGMTDSTTGAGYVNFFGLENWYGCTACWIDNVDISSSGMFTITEDDGITRKVQGIIKENSYTSKFVIGEHLDLVAKEASATIYTSFCAGWSVAAAGCVVAQNFNWDLGNFGTIYSKTTSYKYANIGSRLAFRGVIQEETDTNAFKSLTAIG